jgi:ABC-type Zn uptake system ZnuABC Zn-binding protein ZnuA
MNKRQKIFVTATVILILTAVFTTVLYSSQNKTVDNKLKVVATFYPLAFFAQQIGGEQVTVKQLIPDNTEVHDWQPSVTDILAVDEADVILYNGASLDQWFEDDILPVIDSNNKVIMETTEGVTLLETDQENDNPEQSHDHEGLYDPHTWISSFIAKQQAQNIYDALTQKDPNNTDYYAARWQTLKTRLEKLDSDYMTELSTKRKDEIFVSHAAFGYLAERYGFKQYGVIGISADEQPSASTYANLVDMMQKHDIYVVYVDPIYSAKSAQTLRNELERLSGHDVQILTLYLMLGEIEGLDYFGQQAKNLENLKIGLEAS